MTTVDLNTSTKPNWETVSARDFLESFDPDRMRSPDLAVHLSGLMSDIISAVNAEAKLHNGQKKMLEIMLPNEAERNFALPDGPEKTAQYYDTILKFASYINGCRG